MATKNTNNKDTMNETDNETPMAKKYLGFLSPRVVTRETVKSGRPTPGTKLQWVTADNTEEVLIEVKIPRELAMDLVVKTPFLYLDPGAVLSMALKAFIRQGREERIQTIHREALLDHPILMDGRH